MAECDINQVLQWLLQQSHQTQATFVQENSEILTKFIRQHKLNRNSANDFLVQKIIDLAIGLLSLPASPFVSDELVALLNNLFNLDCRFLEKILVNSGLLKNLREYCIGFFKKYQNFLEERGKNDQPSKLYFSLYSAVYLLAIFASHKSVSN